VYVLYKDSGPTAQYTLSALVKEKNLLVM